VKGILYIIVNEGENIALEEDVLHLDVGELMAGCVHATESQLDSYSYPYSPLVF
jgi:hypothetical protein